jgi:hypothetical protein
MMEAEKGLRRSKTRKRLPPPRAALDNQGPETFPHGLLLKSQSRHSSSNGGFRSTNFDNERDIPAVWEGDGNERR